MNFTGKDIVRFATEGWTARVLPWLVGGLVFWVVSYTFFAPQFDDKSLGQGDIAQYSGMSADIRAHREAKGEDPQWTGGMFSGMPAYLIDVEYPTQDVKQTVGSVVKVVGDPMNMIFFAMVAMMLAVVLMGINPWIGIIAGLAYGLSTYFFLIIDAGHITKMWALVYAPPMVGAVWYALRRNVWVGSALAAMFGSLELGANHPQITYYFLLACLALWISEFVFAIIGKYVKKFALATVMLGVAALLALGSNFAPLWYTMQHRDSTSRGESEVVDEEAARQQKIDYNTMWSYGKAESLNMLVPNYMGSSSSDVDERVEEFLSSDATQEALVEDAIDDVTAMYQEYDPAITREDILYYMNNDPNLRGDVEWMYSNKWSTLSSHVANYWGAQPYTAGPTYLGAVVVFLAIVGMVLAPARYRWWLLTVSIFMLLLAWGSNLMGFYETMYDYLPGYKNFRTVSMALVILEWSAPLFAALALWQLLSADVAARKKYIAIAVGFGVVVLMYMLMALNADYRLAALVEDMGSSYWVEQFKLLLEEVRSEAFVADAWRSMGYVIAVMAVAVGYILLANRGRIERRVLNVAMVAVVGLLVVVDMTGVDSRYMNEDKWHDVAPMEVVPTKADREILKDKDLGYRVYDADSRGSARAANFHRSVDGYHGAKLQRYDDVLHRYIYPEYSEVLAMLNTRYTIADGAVEQNYTFGPAWFVSGVEAKATPVEEFDALGLVDLSTTAVVSSEVKGLEEWYDTSGYIEVVEYAPNYLKYEYESPAKALCVFSEIYFPEGWTAYIDGQQVDYFSVDYILRGMELPAGEHIVEWRFKAPKWGMATAITGIASWLILLSLVALVAVPIYRRVRGGRNIKRVE
ncbi:MAG: hypothetical protein II204_06735 [Alistipes sp.]|nr:hypothetical protein [Alistipes sp.]